MDRKITELDSIEQIQGDEYFVIASKQYNENYKVKVSNFIDQMDFITVDDELSLTSTNPVQNRVITEKLNELDDRLDNIDGGNDSSTNFDLVVASVETETLPAGKQANVEITDLGTVDNVKSLAFSFAIPKGADGAGGSGDGYESFGYRTVFAFKHNDTKPSKPVGGSWDPVTNIITYPSGWSASDSLERPVYMSNATFGENGIVTDWSDPICISGEDGEDGAGGGSDGSDSKAREFIYTRTKEEKAPGKPSNNPYVDDYVPRDEGWEDHPQGISEDILCEWVCTRTYNDSTGVWNNWEGPALWAKYGVNGKDGDGVEYIYQLSSNYDKPATPGRIAASHSPVTSYQEREFIPAKASTDEFEWQDNPSDVTISIPYQWVSVRKFNWKTQLWGDFEEPTLWAKYGKDGDEAVAAFKSFVFRRTNVILTSSDTPKGGNYASPIPTNVDGNGKLLWSDGVPDGSEILWMSSRIFTANGGYPQQDVWTVPKQMTDTANFDVEFSSMENPGAPTGHPNQNANWSNTSDSTTIWMATSTMNNGVWSAWQMARIRGEKGDAGTSINILGSFDSYEELLATVTNPNMGDCYLINGELYVWDGDEWINVGSIQGPQGPAGNGIKQVKQTYQVHTNGDTPPTGTWLDSSPATNDTYKYLWRRTIFTYTNVGDLATDNLPIYEVVGVHGAKGIDGDSIEFIFCLTKENKAPSVPASPDPIDKNSTKGEWTDDAQGPDSTWPYEWVSSHVKTYDESQQKMVWGDYSAASHWATHSNRIDHILAQYAVHSKISDTDEILSGLDWLEYSPATSINNPYLWKRTKTYFTDGTATADWSYECIGKSGEPGIDGETTEYIFILSNESKSSNITVPSSNDPITTNRRGYWSDDAQGPNTDYIYEYVSSHTKSYDESQQKMVWGPYGPASLWARYSEDGKGILKIAAQYAIHTLGEDVPANLEYLSWSDASSDVTKDKPYLWKRTKVYFTDGSTSDAWQYEMIGKLGDKGIDGESIQFAFKLTTDKKAPYPPKTDVEGSNIIGAWTDDPQMLGNYDADNNWVDDDSSITVITYKYQWVSQRTKTVKEEETEGTWGDWSDATLWSELYPGTYLHIKYSNDIENKQFTDNNGEDVGKYIGMLVDYNIGDSGDFDDYTWRKFEGNDGFGREYIFKLGDDYTSPPDVPSRQSGDNVPQFEPTGWNVNPVIPNNNDKYCWCCHRDGNGDTWGDWVGNSTNPKKAYLFSMYAESVKGDTGQDGPILFPAGYWESGKLYEQILREDESVQATPYVYDVNDNKYYYLIAESVQSSTRPVNDTLHWVEMATFNAIYTDILLANNAKVGQAVFNGNYMFSQNGIDSNGDPTTGTEYTLFNHNNPYLETNDFRPTWCVNLVTGEMWTGAGGVYMGKTSSDTTFNVKSNYGEISISQSGFTYKFTRDGKVGGLSVTDDYIRYVGVSADQTSGGTKSTEALWVNADGSGTIANGAISWDANGNVTHFPKSGIATITATGNITRTTVTAKINVSDDYGTINSASVVIGSVTKSITDLTAGASDYIVTITGTSAFAEDSTIKLYINGKLAAENAINFSSIGGGTISGTNYSIVLNVTSHLNANMLYLHSASTRSSDSTGMAYIGNIIEDQLDSGIRTVTLIWNTTDGLSVNTKDPGEDTKLFAGDTVYVFFDDERITTKSFTLRELNVGVNV